MNRIKRTIILLILVLALPIFNVNVIATTENVSSVFDGGAEYYVDNIKEERDLGFGVKYHNDAAYSRINKAEYNQTGQPDTGSSSTSSGTLELGKYYTQNVNVLEIPNDSGVNVVSYANIKVGTWTLTTVKAMISKYEEKHPDEKVIAAINGDFFDINSNKNYPKTSTGGTVSNGNYYKVVSNWKAIGFKNDENGLSMIGNIYPSISQKPILELFDNDGNVIYSIDVDKINEEPLENETSVYFTFYDEKHNYIEENVSSATIVTGDEIVPFSTSSIYGKGEVTEVNKSGTIKNNQFAIVSNNNELNKKLEKGVNVRCQYYYTGDLAGYDNVIGYPHNLIVDGNYLIEADNYRHPRTMIGTKEDGTIIMTTIDGRRSSKGYYGASPAEEIALMNYYGCTNAYNLDGGGSTTMVILEDGEFVIKNEPSDNSPRSDGNCLLITVNVPTLDLSFEAVSQTSFDIKVLVVKEIAKYNDLYIEINDEKKQIINGKASFSGLSKNTQYTYKFYAKVNGKLLGLPIEGTISTAKEKYAIESVTCLEIKDNRGEEYYTFSFNINDEDKTLVNMILDVNGKKYYRKDNTFTIPKGKLSNMNTYLILTYDLNDQMGRITINLKDFNANYLNSNQALESITNDVNVWFDTLISNNE